MADLLLLAMLAEGPVHGYTLKRQAGSLLGGSRLHSESVYPALRRFAARGWVERRPQPGARGRDKIAYALTRAGRGELVRRASHPTPAELRSGDGFLLRVGLFDLLPATAVESVLAGREAVLAGQAASLARAAPRLERGSSGAAVVRFLRRRNEGERRWIASLRKRRASR